MQSDPPYDKEANQWSNELRTDHPTELKKRNREEVAALTTDYLDIFRSLGLKTAYASNPELVSRIELVRGNIVTLDVDAIVNAANELLLGGGGIDEAIHRAAGPGLRAEAEKLPTNHQGVRCSAGEARLTGGHNLRARYVIHTVAPYLDESDRPQDNVLQRCYRSCLQYVDGTNIRSIAFCCLGTGFYGFPIARAATIALTTVRAWLETADNLSKVDRIIFCCYSDLDYDAYQMLLPVVFPRD